jgi:hypothetical protein
MTKHKDRFIKNRTIAVHAVFTTKKLKKVEKP